MSFGRREIQASSKKNVARIKRMEWKGKEKQNERRNKEIKRRIKKEMKTSKSKNMRGERKT